MADDIQSISLKIINIKEQKSNKVIQEFLNRHKYVINFNLYKISNIN